MSPVKPSDITPLLIKDSDDFCTAFAKLLQSFYKLYLFARYITQDSGGLGVQFTNDICGAVADCNPPTTPVVTIPPDVAAP